MTGVQTCALPIYTNYYGIGGLFERLRADDARYPDTMDQRFGSWAQLLTLYRLIYDGGSHGPKFDLPARRGYLFDPSRYPFLEGRSAAGDSISVPAFPTAYCIACWRTCSCWAVSGSVTATLM